MNYMEHNERLAKKAVEKMDALLDYEPGTRREAEEIIQGVYAAHLLNLDNEIKRLVLLNQKLTAAGMPPVKSIESNSFRL